MEEMQIEVRARVNLKEPVKLADFEQRLVGAYWPHMISFEKTEIIDTFVVAPGNLSLDLVRDMVFNMLEPGEWADIDLFAVELKPTRQFRLTELGSVWRSDKEAA